MRDQLLGGRYRLVQELGDGGMGQVWEAEDETLGRPVAVKVISLLAGGGSRGDEARARFLREARITARLQHPHIVTVHDLGESGPENGNAPFLVMELVRGEGLDAKLARGGVSREDAASWGAQVCDALAEAHAAGVMHRDIKPSNIFITDTGVVKVLDFGIARAADPYATADRLTQTGFIVGTPPYMAPEQARGYPEPGSDLYALGCLLFELVTGRLPFEAPDSVGYLTAHLSQEPPAPSAVRPGIPGSWDRLVGRLLRKDPAERYETAADVARALRQLGRAESTKVLTRQDDVPVPRSSPTRSMPVGGRWLPGTVWLLTVVVTAILVSINHDGEYDGRDAATGAAAVAVTTAWLIGYFVLMSRPGWRAPARKVIRFLLPLLLLGMYGTVVASTAGEYGLYGRYWWRLGVTTVPLVILFALAATLTPRTGLWTRRVGYALVAFIAVALLDSAADAVGIPFSVTPYLAFVHPEPATVPPAVVAVTMYCLREIATRRAAGGQRLFGTEVDGLPSTVGQVLPSEAGRGVGE